MNKLLLILVVVLSFVGCSGPQCLVTKSEEKVEKPEGFTRIVVVPLNSLYVEAMVKAELPKKTPGPVEVEGVTYTKMEGKVVKVNELPSGLMDKITKLVTKANPADGAHFSVTAASPGQLKAYNVIIHFTGGKMKPLKITYSEIKE